MILCQFLLFFFTDRSDLVHRDDDPSQFCLKIDIGFAYFNKFSGVKDIVRMDLDDLTYKFDHDVSPFILGGPKTMRHLRPDKKYACRVEYP